MCGIVGIISKKQLNTALVRGLSQLQHRGQDAVGIFSHDPKLNQSSLYKGMGLLKDNFDLDKVPHLGACWGLGHVRYATTGNQCEKDAQPLMSDSMPTLAIVVNGNLSNFESVKNTLKTEGAIFNTDSDAELILYLLNSQLKQEICTFSDICEAITHIYQIVKGSYSVIGIHTGCGLFAFRDPYGIRPLLYGIQPDSGSYCFASEVNALSTLGYMQFKTVEPGEAIFVDSSYQIQTKMINPKKHAHCSFEFAYFSHPNNQIDGIAVHEVRKRLGIALAKKITAMNIPLDVVVPIPMSGFLAAQALSEALNIPCEEGIKANESSGRTFVLPSINQRDQASDRKFYTIPSIFKGRNVVLVDDSIVRGTVSKKVVQLARQAGAKNVYFASSFPPIKNPCNYGMAFPSKEELMSHQRNLNEIAQEIDVSQVFYTDYEDLKSALKFSDFCAACVTGHYPD